MRILFLLISVLYYVATWCTYGPKLGKWKNSTLKKFLCFIIFWKMKLSGSNIKNFPTFSYILGNGNPEKNSLYFREFQVQAQKIKKPL